MAIIYGLKVNLSVAMVAMLNHTALKLSSDTSHIAQRSITNLTTTHNDDCGSDSATSAAVEVNEHHKIENYH